MYTHIYTHICAYILSVGPQHRWVYIITQGVLHGRYTTVHSLRSWAWHAYELERFWTWPFDMLRKQLETALRYIYICIYIHTHTRTHIHTYVHTHTHKMFINVCVHLCTYATKCGQLAMIPVRRNYSYCWPELHITFNERQPPVVQNARTAQRLPKNTAKRLANIQARTATLLANTSSDAWMTEIARSTCSFFVQRSRQLYMRMVSSTCLHACTWTRTQTHQKHTHTHTHTHRRTPFSSSDRELYTLLSFLHTHTHARAHLFFIQDPKNVSEITRSVSVKLSLQMVFGKIEVSSSLCLLAFVAVRACLCSSSSFGIRNSQHVSLVHMLCLNRLQRGSGFSLPIIRA